MKGSKAVLASIMALCAFGLASGAWAQAQEIHFTGTTTTTGTIDEGERWTDEDGILHVRGAIRTSITEGFDENGVSFTANGEAMFNLDLDTATGDGHLVAGRVVNEYVYGDLQGGFEGQYTATITGYVLDGEFNYPHGSGDFSGWHVRGLISGILGQVSQIEGIIQMPH